MSDSGSTTSGTGAACRIGILASGRGSNMEALIAGCRDGQIPARIAVVLSDREKSGALTSARRAGIEAIWLDPKAHASREDYDRALAHELQSRGVNLVCLAGYMKLVTAAFIKPFAGRILNIHPSLLPSFPGLNGQKQALEYGCKVAGCTVHLVELEMDSGPIVMQSAVAVEDDDTEETLSARILAEEHRIYRESVRRFAAGEIEVRGRRVVRAK